MKDFLTSPLWHDFLQVLHSHLKREYLGKGLAHKAWNAEDTRYFSKGVLRLNPLFTTERTHRASNYFSDPILRSGYLAYYLPVNLIKTVMTLERGFFTNVIWPETIRIADLGAGPLTMSLGFLLWMAHAHPEKLRHHHIHIDAFEQNPAILRDGEKILKNLLRDQPLLATARVTLQTHRIQLLHHRFRKNPCDLLLLGNFFNEIAERQDQWRFVQNVFPMITEIGSRVLIIEPGTKKSARDLQQLRDDLISRGGFTVLSPCLHQNTCPLNLEAKGDWCHFTQDWQTPDFIRDMDHVTRMDKKWLVYSYLLLEKNQDTMPAHDPFGYVAITNLFKKQGQHEIVGCGPPGRVRFVLMSRERSENNRALLNLRRGTYFTVTPLKITAPPRGEQFYSLGADTLVKIENSFSTFTKVLPPQKLAKT